MTTVTITGIDPNMFDRAAVEIRDELASIAISDVHRILDQRIMHPTPYYETQIANDVDGPDRVVHDRGIVYGPWLEGTSTRNRTTRFKGYHAFGTAAATVQARMSEVVDRVIGRYTS